MFGWPEWKELLSNPELIEGDIEWTAWPRHYGGNIVKVTDRGDKVTFHFSWSAARTKQGWSARNLRKVTLRKGELSARDPHGYTWNFCGDTIYLRGHGTVTQNEVVPQRTHRDREKDLKEKEEKKKRQGSLFN